MKLTKVTITGADDGVDPRDLLALSADFPFVEWAILVSESRFKTPRYPSLSWIFDVAERFEQEQRRDLAAHLCGKSARDTQAGKLCWIRLIRSLRSIERIQINGFDFATGLHQNLMVHRASLILQARTLDDLSAGEEIGQLVLVPPHVLYDPSGGRGVAAPSWPPPHPWIRIGYAGGIGPENVSDVAGMLCSRLGDAEFWIDMESGVRDERDAFDLEKAASVLRRVEQHVDPSRRRTA